MTIEASPPFEAAPAPGRKIQVIFVCTGNSARSQMAEAILRQEAGDRFEVVSGFLGSRFDYVITLCDRARLTCPVFPGGKETLHWGLDDPTEVEGPEAEQDTAFDRVLTEVSGRIRRFVPLAISQGAR